MKSSNIYMLISINLFLINFCGRNQVQQNSGNRKKVKAPHITGRKPFIIRHQEIVSTNVI